MAELEAVLDSAGTAANSAARPLHRLSVRQYHDMIQAGVFSPGDRVELIEGYLISMAAVGPPHSYSVGKANKLFTRVLPDDWHTRIQQPVTFLKSEPEPDLCIVRGALEDYRSRHPSPKEIGLLIEVPDSTLGYDRDLKCQLYANARVAQYWIINLIDYQLEVFEQPRASQGKPATYRRRQTLSATEMFTLQLDNQKLGVFRVRDLLP